MKACNSCGKCCIKYSNGGLAASQADLDLWLSLRPDIDKYVRDNTVWVDPLSGEPLERCPWLRKEAGQQRYSCAIYLDRPEDCRLYPALVSDMVKDDCEMLEPQDRLNLRLAQQQLDGKYKDKG